jgi:peptidoglycan glycosyltransferase
MDMGKNICRMTMLFTVSFLVLSVSLVYWQVYVAQELRANVHNSRLCLAGMAPLRGNIYDRNGVLLAESIRDPNFPCGYYRHYSEPSLAGLVGYDVHGYAPTGIERQFDDVLGGRSGSNLLKTTVNQLLHRPPVGNDIYLTVDVRIQRIVAQRFAEPGFVDNNLNYASDRGSVIVMDPHTGEVLAMFSSPGFDVNKMVQTLSHGDKSYYQRLNQDPKQPLLFRPLQGRYIPGSTYKAVTLLAGLDAGKTSLDQPFNERQARGPIYYDGHPIGPVGNNIDGYTRHFPVTTEYGFAHSDNVIFAQIGVNTGFNTWMEYNKRFYVGQQIPFDLPTAVSTVLPPGRSQLSNLQLASNAFGQGTDFVTPLQMSLIDNVPAADGRLYRPMLISKIANHVTHNTLWTFDPRLLGMPVSSQTATQVRQAMYGVTHCGSGIVEHVNLNQSPWGIIGKTGTAQVSAGSIPAHGWMITQAPYTVDNPAQLPALTIVAMKENAGEGGSAVGPMIAGIYHDIFSQGYVQATQIPLAGLGYCHRTGLLQS